jgi:phenylpropionate dioxygenase-like ring-hydroxylating dioxygenase large terminal subunit
MALTNDTVALRRVGPGTPMGRLIREYWIPALKSSELVADGPPVRLMLLGEKLLAFRDSAGRVGIMDHRCPHRCASLFFGRNEEHGIRCAFHGWKFDVSGRCIDQPNLPKHQQFMEKVSAKAYKAVDRNGIVWAYMGARAVPPPMPCFGPTRLAADQVEVTLAQRECNWLQALEGDIDNSHISFLHRYDIARRKGSEKATNSAIEQVSVQETAPEYEVLNTNWGMMYGVARPGGPGTRVWRVGHFLFPFWSMISPGNIRRHVVARAWVPIDDTHAMFVNLRWVGSVNDGDTDAYLDQPASADPALTEYARANRFEYLPNTTDWFGRWRLSANAGNDYKLDRHLQKTGVSFSGVRGVHMQDQAIAESMGEMTDHEFEHLAASDLMVARTRRRLFQAAEALAASGTIPPGVDDPESFAEARGGNYAAPDTMPFLDTYHSEMKQAVHLEAAE